MKVRCSDRASGNRKPADWAAPDVIRNNLAVL
jgi:hypothetical protein